MIMHSQLDIRGVRRETGQHKIKRSMRLLRNVIAVLYNGLPHPKGENVSMGTKCKIRCLLGYPCKVKLYHATSKAARRFRDIIEWVRT